MLLVSCDKEVRTIYNDCGPRLWFLPFRLVVAVAMQTQVARGFGFCPFLVGLRGYRHVATGSSSGFGFQLYSRLRRRRHVALGSK